MNAIIMAAGMSSRFAPLSYEKPKGLLVVKGEVLIEQQIRQLKEAGITDITIVVGYMKEQFFYLEDKFDVQIVINEDYYRYNNTSTLIRVIDKIDETFICSSDNYFSENVFLEQPSSAYYAAEYAEGKTDEYCLTTDSEDIITDVHVGGENAWYMIGHVYFDHQFSTHFCEILKREYEKSAECRESLWEDLYAKHLDVLKMRIKRYPQGIIHEFDSLDELRAFDSLYINNTDSSILRNICNVLHCEQSNVQDIHAIKQGLTNTSFYFYCSKDGKQYVYRHPGVGTSDYIDRKSEFFSMQYAKNLGLDDTFIQMDEKSGWKMSHYLDGCHSLDYHNDTEVNEALRMMRKLHDANIHSKYDFDLWVKTEEFITKIKHRGRTDFTDFEELYKHISHLYQLTKTDGVAKRLCHCDCYDPNFLIDKNGKMYLIDWEYSGNDDPGSDLGTFICCSDYTEQEADCIFERYLQRKPNNIEIRHFYAYVSLAAYYWFVWAIYQTSVGNNVGEYLYLWYKMAKNYYKKAIKLY